MKKYKKEHIVKYVKMVIVASAICITFKFTTSSIIPIMFGILFGLAQNRAEVSLNKREFYIKNILSVFYSLCIVGINIDNIFLFSRSIYNLLSLTICTYGIYLCVKVITTALIVEFRINFIVDSKRIKNKKKEHLVFSISLLLLLVIWGIFLAMSYPANLTNDSKASFEQLTGAVPLNIGHPIIYTMTLKLFYAIGCQTANYNWV